MSDDFVTQFRERALALLSDRQLRAFVDWFDAASFFLPPGHPAQGAAATVELAIAEFDDGADQERVYSAVRTALAELEHTEQDALTLRASTLWSGSDIGVLVKLGGEQSGSIRRVGDAVWARKLEPDSALADQH